MTSLAILGGAPAFPEGLPITRPAIPSLERVVRRLEKPFASGLLTNGANVRELEATAAERLGVAHVIAVSCCTAGLMLATRALCSPLDGAAPARGGVAVLPSFTFSASGHALAWNGLDLRFGECDADTFQADTPDLADRLDGASLLCATHIFGAPCDVEGLEAAAAAASVPLLFDAAHGFGATHAGRPVGGFGDVEVFSMSPTKVVVAGEGGLVATDRADVAESVRIGRDYGNPGDYDTRFVGLNARMSELHAAVALESLADLDENLALRQAVADRYRRGLAGVPGIRCQEIGSGDTSTYKDFTIAVDAAAFGTTRDRLRHALAADGIDSRCYFDPPLHRQQSYAHVKAGPLPRTEALASQVLSLPVYPSLTPGDVDRVAEVIAAVQANAPSVGAVA